MGTPFFQNFVLLSQRKTTGSLGFTGATVRRWFSKSVDWTVPLKVNPCTGPG